MSIYKLVPNTYNYYYITFKLFNNLDFENWQLCYIISLFHTTLPCHQCIFCLSVLGL